MSGKIMTVLGEVPSSELGVTLPHEHLSINLETFYVPPKDLGLSKAKFNLENSGWIRQNPFSHTGNLIVNDRETELAVLQSVKEFKAAGGGCLVDNSVLGLHRRTSFLREVSQETGVKVVAGTGYYVAAAQDQATLALTQEQMSDFMTRELTVGCFDDSSTKCGLIGEIGCSWPLIDFEKRAIQASAAVQQAQNCAVSFHPGRDPTAPFEILRIFQEAGGKADKTIMSHLERTIFEHDTLSEFARLGGYCQFDLFGLENSYYQVAMHIDMASDAQRMDSIAHLVKEGFGDKVLMAQDIHTKNRLETFGGHGFAHILKNVVPKMLDQKKMTKEQIHKILVTNPAMVLEIGQ